MAKEPTPEEPQPVKVTNWPGTGCGCGSLLMILGAIGMWYCTIWGLEDIKTAIDQNTKAIEALPHSPPPPASATPATILEITPESLSGTNIICAYCDAK